MAIVRSRDSRGLVWRLRTEPEPVDGRTDTIAGDLVDGGVRDAFVSSFSFSLLGVDGVAFGIGGISSIVLLPSRPYFVTIHHNVSVRSNLQYLVAPLAVVHYAG
jgi:hypothetical protein